MYSTVFALLLYVFASLTVGSVGVFISFLLYLCYLHKIYDHIPSPPRSSFILGHLPTIMQYKQKGRPLVHYCFDNRMKYGPICVIFVVHQPFVIVGDAVAVRKVCIELKDHVYKKKSLYEKLGFVYGERGVGYGLATNSVKESWQKRRQLINPTFHRKSLKEFITDFNHVCDRFLERMNDVAESKETVSMLNEFGRVTLDIISQVSFHINLGSTGNPESRFPKAVRCYFRAMQANLESPLSPTLLSMFQFRLIQTATQRQQIDATKFLRKFASERINSRLSDIKAGKDVPNDLLSILVNEKSLTMDDIIDEFLTIFIAGHETTANTLAFALYEIVNHPEAEAKILKEIEEAIGEKDYTDFEDLVKLKYLNKVMQETLRKYPVGIGPCKSLSKDSVIGGYRIPKGAMVSCDNYAFSYNADIWKDPEVFDPERFNHAENIPNFSSLYFPFSLGPRSCIGKTFAKFEFLVVFARILRQFQFKLLPGQTATMEERLALAPRDGVMCKVVKR